MKNLDPLLNCHIALGQLSSDATYYKIPNAFMASEPGEDFWLLCALDSLAAPITERERAETHTGPLRLEWALRKYNPKGTVIYPDNLIYPIDWHKTNPNFPSYNKWADGTARSLRMMTPKAMAERLPDAYAVTFWAHNW
jgi:hypothetical protein